MLSFREATLTQSTTVGAGGCAAAAAAALLELELQPQTAKTIASVVVASRVLGPVPAKYRYRARVANAVINFFLLQFPTKNTGCADRTRRVTPKTWTPDPEPTRILPAE
jgi:hypothetical protein